MKYLVIALTAIMLVGCGEDRPVVYTEPVYVEPVQQREVVYVDNSNTVMDAVVTGMIINAMTSDNDREYDRPVTNTTVVNKTVVVNNKKKVKAKKYVKPKPKANVVYYPPVKKKVKKKVKKTSFSSKSSYSKTKKKK